MRDVRSHLTLDDLDEATLALVTDLADQLHERRVAERRQPAARPMPI